MIEVIEPLCHLEHVVGDVQGPEFLGGAQDDRREIGDRLQQRQFLRLRLPEVERVEFSGQLGVRQATIFEDPAGPGVRVLDVRRGVTFEREGLLGIEDDHLVAVAGEHHVLDRADRDLPGDPFPGLLGESRILLVDDGARPRQHRIADILEHRGVALAR